MELRFRQPSWKFSNNSLTLQLSFVLVLVCSGLFAQSTFNIVFNHTVDQNWSYHGGSGGLSVHQSPNGYKVFAAQVSNGGYTKPFVFHFDNLGQFLFHVELYDSTSTDPNSFQINWGVNRAVGDTSIPNLAFLSQWGLGKFEESVTHIVRLDNNGDTLWSKVVQDTSYYNSQASVRTIDSNLAGSGFGVFDSITTGIFLLVDSLGETISFETYPGTRQLPNITELPTGDFILSGFRLDPNGIDPNLIVRTDSFGNELWREYFGGHFGAATGNNPVIVTNNGDILVATTWQDPNGGPLGPKKLLLKKWDNNGNELWQQMHFQENQSGAVDLIELNNGDILVLGQLNNAIIPRAYIARFDPIGNLVWKREHTYYTSPANYTQPRDLELTSDGGFVVTGDVQQGGTDPYPGLQMTWLLKTDSLGCVVPGCHLVGVEEQKIEALQVFPNPFTNEIFVEAIVERVELYDMTGRLVRSVDSNRLTGLEDLPPALYIVKADNLFARVIKE